MLFLCLNFLIFLDLIVVFLFFIIDLLELESLVFVFFNFFLLLFVIFIDFLVNVLVLFILWVFNLVLYGRWLVIMFWFVIIVVFFCWVEGIGKIFDFFWGRELWFGVLLCDLDFFFLWLNKENFFCEVGVIGFCIVFLELLDEFFLCFVLDVKNLKVFFIFRGICVFLGLIGCDFVYDDWDFFWFLMFFWWRGEELFLKDLDGWYLVFNFKVIGFDNFKVFFWLGCLFVEKYFLFEFWCVLSLIESLFWEFWEWFVCRNFKGRLMFFLELLDDVCEFFEEWLEFKLILDVLLKFVIKLLCGLDIFFESIILVFDLCIVLKLLVIRVLFGDKIIVFEGLFLCNDVFDLFFGLVLLVE